MFGYINKNKAKSVGFTHQGRYFGIPLWLTYSQTPMMAAKWGPMEWIISFLQLTERSFIAIFMPGDEFTYQVSAVKLIDK